MKFDLVDSQFHFDGHIGSGGFGEVKKGSFLKDGIRIPVAIKIMISQNPFALPNDFEKELKVIEELSHPNIVKFYGTLELKETFLVFEFLKRDLRNFLRDVSVERDNKTLISIAYDISCGMEYLHGISLIHRDLSARNVLLNEDNMAKVADFGLSRFFEEGKEHHSATITRKINMRWSPIECTTDNLQRKATYSKESDIWSFGVTLLEMWTEGQTPYGDGNKIITGDMLREGPLSYERKHNPEIDGRIEPSILKLMENHIFLEKDRRVNFLTIKSYLHELKGGAIPEVKDFGVIPTKSHYFTAPAAPSLGISELLENLGIKIKSEIPLTENLGSQIIANGDFLAGTIIFDRISFINLPGLSEDLNDPQETCIGCNKRFDSVNAYECEICSWQFCSMSCTREDIHTLYECKIFHNQENFKDQISSKGTKERSYMFAYFRLILLKLRDPETWELICHRPAASYQGFYKEKIEKLQQQITLYLEDEKWAKDLFKVTEIIFRQELVKTNYTWERIYKLDHIDLTRNCFPNCGIYATPDRCLIWNAVDMKKGEVLTYNLSDTLTPLGAVKNQHQNLYFCNCARCQDPSELGTFLSAVKCTDCKDGYLLAENPLDVEMDAKWICNRPSECKGNKTWKDIEEITTRFELQNKNILEIVSHNDVDQYNGYLDILRSNLHKNHWVLLNFENELIKNLHSILAEKEETKITDERFKFQLGLIDHLESIVEITSPGITIKKDSILTYRVTALMHKYNSLKNDKSIEIEARKLKIQLILQKIILAIDQLLQLVNALPAKESRGNIERLKHHRYECERLLKKN